MAARNGWRDFCVENASAGVALDVVVTVENREGDAVWRCRYAALYPGRKVGVARLTTWEQDGCGSWDGRVSLDHYEYDGSERLCVEYKDNVLESGLGFITGKIARKEAVVLEQVTLATADDGPT